MPKRPVSIFRPDRWTVVCYLLALVLFQGGYAQLFAPHDSMDPALPLAFLGRAFPFLTWFAQLLLLPLAPLMLVAKILVDDGSLPVFIYARRDALCSLLVAGYLYPTICAARTAVHKLRSPK